MPSSPYRGCKTDEQIGKDGWFYPGDMGQLTQDGWLRMVGRLKEIVNCGGEKFSSKDIEDAVASHPDINQCVVCPIPDERFGEVVGDFVKLETGKDWDGPEPILAHLEKNQLAK